MGFAVDAWTEDGTPFVAIIAITSTDKFLLCFSTLPDESDMSADATIDLFDYVLDTYGIDAATQMCFYVCYHASVNVAIARKTSVSVIGCTSHRMNLAMQALMSDYTDLLEKVHRLMSKLNTIQNRHRLREADALMPTFALPRYEDAILYHLPPCKVPQLRKWNSQGFVGKERSHTRTERTALAKVLHSDSLSQVRDPVDHQNTSKKRSFAEAALAKEAATATSFDLGWIPPTSNDVERLFSRAGIVYSRLRRSLNPMTLETVMFLQYNMRLWDGSAVAKAVENNRKSVGGRVLEVNPLDEKQV
ncbi:hypothetical protein F443_13265 [Phytophthora nicotianae P1569]|uniref:HAT C-terminal dimerisation domain-containing protein n=1 Tax=Phytophthora nicotianae P1569 TaxID=1317065 RepID=V9ETV2_PHYNI|nr:hypothetical protein F443_13265 [Phytophthora nicotianae P1569]